MTALLQTAPANALSAILHSPLKTANADIVLLDYRDPATFRALWLDGLEPGVIEIGDQKINLTDSTKQFLIIGNDPPEDIFDTKAPPLAGINFRSHFTATSWLATWKVKFSPAEKEIDEKESVTLDTRIAVIDPRPAGSATGVAQALQCIFSARDATGQPLVPRANVLNAPSLEAICQWLKPVVPETRTLAKNARHLRELLKSTIWNELISNREQHHSLSNVLGAFLLSAQVGKGGGHGGDPWVQDYLVALVRACGLEVGMHQVRLKEHKGNQRWLTPAQQQAAGALVLLDDMGGIWEYFLRGATGFTGPASFGETARSYRDCLAVFGKDDFGSAIQQLPGRLVSHFESRMANLTAGALLESESKIYDDFILFLDLRLFSRTNGQAGDAEREFFDRLADFGLRLLESRRNLPWLDQDGRQAMKLELEAIKGGAGNAPNLPPVETVLPRLLSLLDPTLPIVIFSSTHRTELIEPFRHFSNIITGLHKPVLSGLAEGWEVAVREMHRDFIDAMDRAAAILRVRGLLRPFQKPLLQN